MHRHGRVELTENLGKPGGTAEYAALPRAHACLGGNILRDQFGGQITRTDILLKRLRYGLRNSIGRDRRNCHDGSLARKTKKPGKAVRLSGLQDLIGYPIR